MSITQVAPQVIVGLESELPLPFAMPVGTIYTATDTQRSFVLVADDALAIRDWQLIIGTGPIYKFSGTLVPTSLPVFDFTMYFSDTLAGDPLNASAPVASGYLTEIPFEIVAPSAHQVLLVRVMQNGFFNGAVATVKKNGLTTVASALLVGGVNDHSYQGIGNVSLSVGDRISFGITYDGTESTSSFLTFTAVLGLNP